MESNPSVKGHFMLLMPEIKLFVLSSCFNGLDLFFAVRFQNQIEQDALILLDQGI